MEMDVKPFDRHGTNDRVELIRALFPDLASELDAAATRHAAPSAAASLDASLDAAAARLMPHAGFADVAEPEGARRAEQHFASARIACGWLDIEMPEIEAFVDAGTDIGRLGSALAADSSLTAVPTPFGCGAAVWKTSFQRAAVALPDAPHDGSAPLAIGSTGDSPLLLATEAEREFDALDTPPPGIPAARAQGRAWTLRLVPSGARPPVLGLGFSHGPHVTLPEVLMLQLMLVASGSPLIDAASFTWLEGSLAGGRLAARHVYDESERAIRITCREVGNQGPHLGARTPLA